MMNWFHGRDDEDGHVGPICSEGGRLRGKPLKMFVKVEDVSLAEF